MQTGRKYHYGNIVRNCPYTYRTYLFLAATENLWVCHFRDATPKACKRYRCVPERPIRLTPIRGRQKAYLSPGVQKGAGTSSNPGEQGAEGHGFDILRAGYSRTTADCPEGTTPQAGAPTRSGTNPCPTG